jgi:RES domain-containing protein
MTDLFVYRISKAEIRADDLSGTGAFLAGGRWNSIGTYMLYTSANSSLAYLETLVHIDEPGEVPKLYVTEIKLTESLIYDVPDRSYPKLWQEYEDIEAQVMGDKWMNDQLYLGFKVKSSVNPFEYNYLLNPLFPDFNNLVKIKSVSVLNIDVRLLK